MARADRAFAGLLALALVSGAILLTLLVTLLPHAARLLTQGASDAADVVAVLVLGLATCGIGLGFGSLFRQLVATAVLIRRLVARKIPIPRRVRVAARGLGLEGRIDVVVDERPFSFCYWFFRPRVCLSSGLVRRLDRVELRAVLVHERHHLRLRDPLRLVIARYFAAGLYVVPVVDELVSFYTLQKEIAADQAAVRVAGGVRPLARALDKALPDADDLSLGLLVPVGSLSVTEARIEQLVAGRQVALVLSPLSVALSAGALFAAAVLSAVQAGGVALVNELPPLLAIPGLLVGPASLLFAAAVSGGLHQLKLVAHR